MRTARIVLVRANIIASAGLNDLRCLAAATGWGLSAAVAAPLVMPKIKLRTSIYSFSLSDVFSHVVYAVWLAALVIKSEVAKPASMPQFRPDQWIAFVRPPSRAGALMPSRLQIGISGLGLRSLEQKDTDLRQKTSRSGEAMSIGASDGLDAPQKRRGCLRVRRVLHDLNFRERRLGCRGGLPHQI